MTAVLAEHEKLARWSSEVSVHASLPTVAPNLSAGGVRVERLSLTGESLWYQVTDGAGLPPVDVHVHSTVTPSRICSSRVSTSSCGTPGLTASHQQPDHTTNRLSARTRRHQNFKNFKISSVSRSRGSTCVTIPYFVAIGQTVAEILYDFRATVCKTVHLTLSDRCLSVCLSVCLRYRDFSTFPR